MRKMKSATVSIVPLLLGLFICGRVFQSLRLKFRAWREVLSESGEASRRLRTGLLKLAVVDAVLLIFAYYVFGNLEWRNSYASSHGFVPTTSFSLLTRSLALAGKGTVLRSPPTLDWIQVVVALLIIVNFVYAFEALRAPRSQEQPYTPSPTV